MNTNSKQDSLVLEIKQGQEAQGTVTGSQNKIRRMQDGLQSNYSAHQQIETTWCETIITFITWLFHIIPFFWIPMCQTVKEYERALIFRFGKISGEAKGPGLFIINLFVDTLKVVDLRISTFNLVPQKMMTKDSVTCTVDAIVFMKVSDPIRAILEVDDYKVAFRNIAATTLRGVIGKYDLQTIISERTIVNDEIRKIIEQDTGSWGVRVPAVEIRDVTLPNNMQRAMAAASEAERERQAKIISARGEAQAAEQLAKAANIANAAPGTLQLRYLHTLVKISAEKNSTILFPLPMEIMRGIQSFADVMDKQSKVNYNPQEEKEE